MSLCGPAAPSRVKMNADTAPLPALWSAEEPLVPLRYVIISHGPSGGGAWTQQGGRKPCEPGTLAFENCSGNAAFVAAPFSPKPGPTFFDNIVIYDNQNAGGTIIDRVVVCSAKFGFYIPASPHADQDGCVLPRGICRPYMACMSLTSVVPEGARNDR